MQKAYEFLKDAGTYYMATVEGDQPRVRPFGTVNVFEGKLYIQTGKVKPVSHQLHANPKAEICAFKDGRWIRVAAELISDDRYEAKASMLDAYPMLQHMYRADDGNTEVFYLKNAVYTELIVHRTARFRLFLIYDHSNGSDSPPNHCCFFQASQTF